MIAFAAGCLLFRMANGESVPLSPDMISAEMLGETARLFDAEFVRQAACAVFHYFRHELGRQTVSVGEFVSALEKVLRGFELTSKAAAEARRPPPVVESDLCRLVSESGEGCELFFFPRLRAELREQLQQAPSVVRFRGLRRCVLQLTGARRWTARCKSLQEQIVGYLRSCLTAETKITACTLVVE
jgi:hypothetical protein